MVLKEREASNGASLTMQTHSAWSFGQRHAPTKAPDGPGAGKYNPAVDRANKTLAYRPELGTRGPEFITRGEPVTGDRYRKPGWLSNEKQGNSWSFGYRIEGPTSKVPGPGTYDLSKRTFKQAHATWGPPPAAKAQHKLGPAPGHVYPGDTSLRPMMHRQLPISYDNGVPAPHDYQPPTAFPPIFKRCTFGHRAPLHRPNTSPGPAYYEPGTTIAAATQRGTVAPLMPHANHPNVSARRH